MRLLLSCVEQGVVFNQQENKFILKQFRLPYIGHIFSAAGLRVDTKKVKAIIEMPRPDSPTAITHFLGMAKCLTKCVPKIFAAKANEERKLREGWQMLELFDKIQVEICHASVVVL